GEKKRICILAEGGQQLRSDGDDLSVHVSSLNEWQALHAPGEMKNGIGGDQDCPATAGECQSNQAVAGDYKAGVLFRRDLNNAALPAQRGGNIEVALGIESQPLRAPQPAVKNRDRAVRIDTVNRVKARLCWPSHIQGA